MLLSEAPRITVDSFGFLSENRFDHGGEIVRRYTITNENNATVKLITLGAAVQSVIIPNKNGDMSDVILGFDNVRAYLKNRYIGRIAGRLSEPFKRQEISSKDNPCSFDIVNWDSYILGDQVVMSYLSRDCKGQLGDLLTQVKYTWTDENRLHIDITATTTKPTPVNITSHCLFNLAGHGMGPKELKRHVATINADRCVEQNVKEECPSNEIKDVYETNYDLRSPKRLNAKTLFKIPGGGYNHNLCINNPSSTWSYRFHARMLHPSTGRFLEVYSNHPTLQMYTGNDFPDPTKICPPDLSDDIKFENDNVCIEDRMIGKDGIPYLRHGCFGLISLGYPESLICDSYPINILLPGKIYTHNITYEFGTIYKNDNISN